MGLSLWEGAQNTTNVVEALIAEFERIVESAYTDETEQGFHEDKDMNKAHNAALDIVTARLAKLKEME